MRILLMTNPLIIIFFISSKKTPVREAGRPWQIFFNLKKKENVGATRTCWRKLVACAPYGRALSSLLYKHEQNARGGGSPLTIIISKKNARVASHRLAPSDKYFETSKRKKSPVWLHTPAGASL